eukprot:469317-Amphidinium_carterae.1
MDAHQLYQLEREKRKDTMWEQLIAKQEFQLVAKYKFRTEAHINIKELLAVRTALRHVVRTSRLWHTRVVVAVHSQVAVYCLKKGRSSSKAKDHVMQAMLGDTLCTGIRLCPIWIATERNPADAPTRKRRIPPPQPPKSVSVQRQQMEMKAQPWTRALNAHEWRQRFDKTLGYPHPLALVASLQAP